MERYLGAGMISEASEHMGKQHKSKHSSKHRMDKYR
jgi:hypothetical protein